MESSMETMHELLLPNIAIAMNDQIRRLLEIVSITRKSYDAFVAASELFVGVDQKLLHEGMIDVSQGHQKPLLIFFS